MTDNKPLFFVTEDGTRLPVTNIFDIDGDEIEDVSQACRFVAMLPDGQWFAAWCDPGEIMIGTCN